MHSLCPEEDCLWSVINILSIENGIPGIKSSLILCGITDQSLFLREGNERRSNTVSLFVGNCGWRTKELLESFVKSGVYSSPLSKERVIIVKKKIGRTN